MKRSVFIPMLLVSLLFACHHAIKPAADAETARIKVAAVSHEKMGFPVRASGLVVSAKEVKLSFKTGGIISGIYADEGTSVRKGTLLALLNLSEIEAQVAQAQNVYDKAMRDFSRARSLFADTVVTLEQLQNAETGMNMAKANLEMASFNMNHSRIVAPDDGVILRRLAETNEIIAPGYPVFLFGSAGKHWKIRAGITDSDFVVVMPGDSARVTLDAYPGEFFAAIVSQVGEAANPLTGTYTIELDLLSVKKRLASGFVANLEIIPSKTEFYYRVPLEAVVEAEGHAGYVFAVTDSATVKKIKVSIAGVFETWVAVSGGLEGIEEVVTEGATYLTDGESVAVVR